MRAIDLDDTGTWPADLWDHVLRRATDLRGTTQYTSDLEIGLDGDGRFDQIVSEHRLRAYHCTRLLPHEVARIRAEGLRPLDEDLVTSRLDQALHHGAVTEDQHRELTGTTVFRRRNANGRQSQVCAVVGRGPFDDEYSGLWRLLTTWGGEAIYDAHGRTPVEHYLSEVGTPSIVVVDLDLGAPPMGGHRHLFSPDLEKVFIGRILGLRGADSSAHYFASVKAADIVDIWQPGHEEYEMHRGLPE
jgi:hypothetical protein